MKRKVLTALCIGVIALSVTGCEKDEKMKKTTTEAATEAVTELPTELIEPEIPGIDDENEVKTGGDEQTGYADVPAEWQELRSPGEEDTYSLQYVNDEQDGLVSFIYNQYGYNNQVTESPADVVISSYQESYEKIGGINLSTEEVYLDGEPAALSVDYIPEGDYADYDYYLYTYVAFRDNTFYTVVIEGREEVISSVITQFEETYSFPDGTGESVENDPDSLVLDGGGTHYAWEEYRVVLDGTEISLPCDFSELSAAGWTVSDDDADIKIAAGDMESVQIEKGGLSISITLGNENDSGKISVADAQVIGVTMDYELEDTESILYSGNNECRMGMSYEEVISVLGQPADEMSEDDFKYLYYQGTLDDEDDFSGLEILISDGAVTKIKVFHW